MIITRHIYPPIPLRQFDWCAYHDGEEETGHYGYGATEAEALEDLKRLDQERDEATQEGQWRHETQQ
jgi:hypothetical protein